MKNAMVQLTLVIIGVSSVHAVKLLQSSTIHAKIYPSTGAERVWAIQGKDSLRMIGKDIIVKAIDVKPGTQKDMGKFTLVQ
jgi:hypothetical protein